jgi:hypothetical protein
VAEHDALVAEAQQVGAKVFFVDEAHFRATHFRADADPRGKWVLKGEPVSRAGAKRTTGAVDDQAAHVVHLTAAVYICMSRRMACRMSAKFRYRTSTRIGNSMAPWPAQSSLRWRARHQGVVSTKFAHQLGQQ